MEIEEDEKLHEWFVTQTLESPKHLEEAARLIITLVTGLLGTLFGVLTIASDKLPYYLKFQEPRWLGILAVGAWLIALGAALVVVLPRPYTVSSASPASQAAAFAQLLQHKSRALRVAVVTFAIGLLALGIVIWVAFLAPYTP